MSKILIVGYGLAGTYLAYRLRRSHNVVAFEEDEEVGRPNHCTGLVSESRFRVFVPFSRDVVLNRYNAIRVTDLDGRFEVIIRLRGDRLVLVDRPRIERALHESCKQDVEVRFRSRVVDVMVRGDRVKLLLGNGQVVRESTRGCIVVVCEGSRQLLSSKILGLRSNHVHGVQCDCRVEELENRLMPHSVSEITVILDERLSRSFFAWIVPIDERTFRVGLGDRGRVRALEALLRRLNAKPVGSPFGGRIVIGPTSRALHVGNVLFVGDAASQTKPLTGGGIITSMYACTILSELIERRDVDVGREYERTWIRALGRNLMSTYKLVKLIHLSPRVRGLVLNALRSLRVRAEVYVEDYDDQFRMVVRGLREVLASLAAVGLPRAALSLIR